MSTATVSILAIFLLYYLYEEINEVRAQVGLVSEVYWRVTMTPSMKQGWKAYQLRGWNLLGISIFEVSVVNSYT